jgi:hypothetical protein
MEHPAPQIDEKESQQKDRKTKHAKGTFRKFDDFNHKPLYTPGKGCVGDTLDDTEKAQKHHKKRIIHCDTFLKK